VVAHVAMAFRLRIGLAGGAGLGLDRLFDARRAAAFVVLGIDQALLQVRCRLLHDAARLDALAVRRFVALVRFALVVLLFDLAIRVDDAVFRFFYHGILLELAQIA
jgi:hypothetical protein